jgi:hypothetical protein
VALSALRAIRKRRDHRRGCEQQRRHDRHRHHGERHYPWSRRRRLVVPVA